MTWPRLTSTALSLLLIAVLVGRGHVTPFRVLLALLPAVCTVSFALFRQTHPPGHDTDLLDLWLHGPGFGPTPVQDELP